MRALEGLGTRLVLCRTCTDGSSKASRCDLRGPKISVLRADNRQLGRRVQSLIALSDLSKFSFITGNAVS